MQAMKQIEAFLTKRKKLGIKPGLERMELLLKLLQHPERQLTAIHIAGTNGKGSTSEYIKQGLQANGYKVGVFTSPSLTGLRGHIVFENEPISEKSFLVSWEEVYPAIESLDEKGMHPTEFEILTAIAFLFFSRHAEIAVIEAGMGGREDTTNCLHPIISIITTIAKDHTAFLGDTITDIASHKAGIIKRKTPVIIGELPQEANAVVKDEGVSKQAPIYQLGKQFYFRQLPCSDNQQNMEWNLAGEKPIQLALSMYGKHQLANASLALMALHLLRQKGLALEFVCVQSAFKKAKLEGRFELVSQQPLVIVDGAHNPEGIKAFKDTVESYFPNRERHLLFAVFKDKDMDRMIGQLQHTFASIHLTTFDHPRAASIGELQKFEVKNKIQIHPSWIKAVKQMKCQEAVYFITGSIHFISLVRAYLKQRNK
ncbi:MAG: bifunctional folylpolyglutamate synthase/dihydrofolate synthase [Virgibacillus proomii]